MIRILWKVFAAAYAWNCAARWEPLPWYRPPPPGSLRDWLERPRPRLHRAGALIVTGFFAFSLIYFCIALYIVTIPVAF